MSMSKAGNCEICDGLLRCKYTVSGREIFACSNCGFEQIGSLQKVKVKTIINEFKKHYLDEYTAEASSYRKYFRNLLKRMPRLARGSRVLDVGCAQGLFMEKAQKLGYIVEGVDAVEENVRWLNKRGFRIHSGLFEQVRLKSKFYDMVVIFQTLEHMKDINKVMIKSKRLLKPGGYLVITTPDNKGLMAKLLRRFWFEYYNKEHLYFFSKSSLNHLLNKYSFKVSLLRTDHGRDITLDYVFSRLINNYYNRSRFIHQALSLTRKLLSPLHNLTYYEPYQSLLAIGQRVS